MWKFEHVKRSTVNDTLAAYARQAQFPYYHALQALQAGNAAEFFMTTITRKQDIDKMIALYREQWIYSEVQFVERAALAAASKKGLL